MSDNSILKSLKKFKANHKKLIQNLDNDTLEIMVKNRKVTREYARESIMKYEPEKLTDEYIDVMTDGMQKTAQMLLAERSNK